MTIPQHCVDDTANVMNSIEALLDEALVLSGQLAGELVKSQNEGRLHPMVMHQEIFSKLPNLIGSLTSSRGAAVDLHKGMNVIAKKLNLSRSDYAAGPPWEKWSTETSTSEEVEPQTTSTAALAAA